MGWSRDRVIVVSKRRSGQPQCQGWTLKHVRPATFEGLWIETVQASMG